MEQVFRRSYRPYTIYFPYHRSRIRKLQNLEQILRLSGDIQIRTLVCAPHVYFDQSALRIFCDVTVRILLKLVRAMFCAAYFWPVASMHYNHCGLVLLMIIFHIFVTTHYCLSMTHAPVQ